MILEMRCNRYHKADGTCLESDLVERLLVLVIWK